MTVSDGLDLEDWVQMKNKEYRAESTLSSIKYHCRIYVIPALLKSMAVMFALMSIVVSLGSIHISLSCSGEGAHDSIPP